MPTTHIADVLLSLDKGSTWSVVIQPGSDSRWSTQTPNYAWDFTLTPQQTGDLVVFRVANPLVDPDHGDFTVAATSTVGTQTTNWSASGGYLYSAAFASGAQVYAEFSVTPVNEDLPLSIPQSANPRGGGHLYVKTSGGPDPRKGPV